MSKIPKDQIEIGDWIQWVSGCSVPCAEVEDISVRYEVAFVSYALFAHSRIEMDTIIEVRKKNGTIIKNQSEG